MEILFIEGSHCPHAKSVVGGGFNSVSCEFEGVPLNNSPREEILFPIVGFGSEFFAASGHGCQDSDAYFKAAASGRCTRCMLNC